MLTTAAVTLLAMTGHGSTPAARIAAAAGRAPRPASAPAAPLDAPPTSLPGNAGNVE